MPRTSSSFMMRSSSPFSLTSLPEYLPKSTRSPALTSSGGLLAGLGHPALADRDDLALLGLLLRAVRDDDGAAASRFVLDPPDEDTVVQWV